eukprot:CAMPEP_0117433396 /NCGR_PEP_ID=MMETSP0758-20121206/12772_1 /TAXON_ID=63605 /ORGANISM="Percolomonas cosmopolitus, Strain AE-1 (ATCC 50343)" /LENGTH=891 /DNA_ID=CAMNT_0005224047 /DNA_START=1559 /DNA_END=4231 /DNA_ORIENTATION=+
MSFLSMIHKTIESVHQERNVTVDAFKNDLIDHFVDLSSSNDIVDSSENGFQLSSVAKELTTNLPANFSITKSIKIVNITNKVRSLFSGSTKVHPQKKNSFENVINTLSSLANVAFDLENIQILDNVTQVNSETELCQKSIESSIDLMVDNIENDIQLGTNPYKIESKNIKLMLMKNKPTSYNDRSFELGTEQIKFPPTMNNDLTQSSIQSDDSVSFQMKKLNFNSRRNKYVMPSTIDLSFKKGKENIKLTNLRNPIAFTLTPNYDEHIYNASFGLSCVYFNETTSTWKNNGVENGGTNQKRQCNTTHLTEFGLILEEKTYREVDLDTPLVTPALNTNGFFVVIVISGIYVALFIALTFYDLVFINCYNKSLINPNINYQYCDTSGRVHYVIPLLQRLRDYHQWISIITIPVSIDRSYTKPQRLTILAIILMGILMINSFILTWQPAVTVYYFIPLANWIMQPIAAIFVYFFSKLKPSLKSKKYKIVKRIQRHIQSKNDSDVELDSIESKTISGLWTMTSLNPKVHKVFFVGQTLQGSIVALAILKNKEIGILSRNGDRWDIVTTTVSPSLNLEEVKCVFNPLQQKFYLFSASEKQTLDVIILDVHSGTSDTCQPDIKLPHLKGFGVVQLNEKIYIYGGEDKHGKLNSKLAYLNTRNLKWSKAELDCMSITPPAKWKPILIMDNHNHLYLLGGYSSHDEKDYHCDVHVFDEERSMWNLIVSQKEPLINSQNISEQAMLLKDQHDEIVIATYGKDGIIECFYPYKKETISSECDLPADYGINLVSSRFTYYDAASNCLHMLKNARILDKSSEESLIEDADYIQKIVVEQKLRKYNDWTILKPLAILDANIHKVVSFTSVINPYLYGIPSFILFTLIYFSVFAGVSYGMYHFWW